MSSATGKYPHLGEVARVVGGMFLAMALIPIVALAAFMVIAALLWLVTPA